MPADDTPGFDLTNLSNGSSMDKPVIHSLNRDLPASETSSLAFFAPIRRDRGGGVGGDETVVNHLDSSAKVFSLSLSWTDGLVGGDSDVDRKDTEGVVEEVDPDDVVLIEVPEDDEELDEEEEKVVDEVKESTGEVLGETERIRVDSSFGEQSSASTS